MIYFVFNESVLLLLGIMFYIFVRFKGFFLLLFVDKRLDYFFEKFLQSGWLNKRGVRPQRGLDIFFYYYFGGLIRINWKEKISLPISTGAEF